MVEDEELESVEKDSALTEKAMECMRAGPWETKAVAVPASVSGGLIVGRPRHYKEPPPPMAVFTSSA